MLNKQILHTIKIYNQISHDQSSNILTCTGLVFWLTKNEDSDRFSLHSRSKCILIKLIKENLTHITNYQIARFGINYKLQILIIF